MPSLHAPQPSSHVGLFLSGLRHDVTEYSTAGLTLHRTALEAPGLDTLRRGEPCPATLQVHGEMYGVVLRLAAQGPLHVEFAFVSLAAQARGALEHYAAGKEVEDEALSEVVSGTELPGPMALAFSRLVEPPVVPAGKRFILPQSEKVYAITRDRRVLEPEPTPKSDPLPDFDIPSAAPAFVAGFGPRETFAYGLAFVLLIALALLWLVA